MNLVREVKFGFGKQLPAIMQTESSECGLACLAMIMNYYGNSADIAELRRQFSVSLKGATLANLKEFATRVGMTSRSLKLELDELPQLQMPAILHWDLNHFVVLKSVVGQCVHVHDPAFGALKLSMKEVSERFTGIALELSPNLQFKRKAAKPPIELRTLIGRVVGLKRGLVQLLGLAIVLEAIALGMPVLSQLITDEAIIGRNLNLLSLLVFGMIGLGISSAMIAAVRSWIGIYISTNFNLQWMSNVMSRLLHRKRSINHRLEGYFLRLGIGTCAMQLTTFMADSRTYLSLSSGVTLASQRVVSVLTYASKAGSGWPAANCCCAC